MKSIEELKTFFDGNLRTDLEGLEIQRKKTANKIIRINIIFALITIISIILLCIINIFAIIMLIASIIIWIMLYNNSAKNYVSDFKEKVIHRIITFIDPSLNYNPASCIPESIYTASKIFLNKVDRYSGDDLVYGKLGQTELTFSEIHSEYKTETRSSSGGTSTQYHTIFKGIFFVASFNKNFKGNTVVLPDVAQKMFGNVIGNLFQSMNKMRGQLIKMEDPDFEKLFVVYGMDQIEARYILSTSLMKRITDYKNKNKKDIYLSFIENKIYVAISCIKNLFEPKIFQTLLDFNIIKEYYEDMSLAVSIVEDLNLNTRIWG